VSRGPWKYPSKKRLSEYADVARDKGAQLIVECGQIRLVFSGGVSEARTSPGDKRGWAEIQ
jgi:hypothetical protein